VKVNRWLDLLDRAAWTFIQAFIAALLPLGFSWESLQVAAVAAGISVLKTVAAQNLGGSELGDAIPGKSVIEQ
jgi:hypothetical protein